MKKRILAIVILVMIICASIVYSFPNFGHGTEAGTVEHTVKTAIRIQYGWGSKHKLQDLCTESMAERMNHENFCLGLRFYSIEENDVYVFDYDESDSYIEISVAVYSPDIRVHVFSLVKGEDGIYRIDNIEHNM